ncbi:site-specific DNA-methyltransferase [Anaerobiospirillum sp. NML120449]|uniref:site-specific DNA-methyltransferase n=1 Tax=Anaerobiospirillum sp. NML120449 TaxID=2932817 RepID=UPI001FF4EDC1|nr:site-specific DNA-methyltransferase [Anaerobiospirillum sp. NML120449]MCK0527362.1 site-specific DNA-methyltransferase [Anaerobiospirillum sp. NML120449]
MDKLSMQSVDGVAANIDIIARHFPSCITEARDPEGQLVHGIDFEKLRAELSSSCIPDKAERYQFTWPGKMDAARLANQPSAATLRPCREESVDFDTTSNLYIEGDNLEVLKVLRNTYAGKVKMIYIDPPYNTGNDFIYEDDFAIDRDDFLVRSGQIGADGERLVVNSDTNGRFHTDWLNMIYPRLKLAREFLSEDGVIFISIDDYESDNMRKVCCEVFGERNFITQFVWQRAYSPKNDAKYVSTSHDYILMFARNLEQFKIGRLPRTEEVNKPYKNPDNDPRGVWQSDNLSVTTYTPGCDYTITTPAGRKVNPPAGSCWRLTRERYEELVRDNRIWFGADGSNTPRLKRFLHELKHGGMLVPESLLLFSDVGHSQDGAKEVSGLMELKVFDGPKPTSLIERLMTIANLKEDSIVMDFFSGSGSTAHTVMKFNVQTGKHCRFILAQIAEAVREKTPAWQAGYRTICEIGKERIRRAGAAVRKDVGLTDGDLDTGFRVLRLDSSNMKDVYYGADEVSLGGFSEFNIKEDRSGEDLLFQVMLDLGIELSSSIEVRSLAGHTVYVVDDGYLAACFDDRVSLDVARAIAGLKPYWFVMCDAAFGSDADADNIKQVFKAVSPMSQIRVI